MNLHESLIGKTIFLTGARGFIGSHLADRLHAAGVRLHLGIRPGAQNAPFPGRPLAPPEAQLHEVDVRDPAALEQTLKKVAPEQVLNLASFTNVSRDSSLEQKCREVNLDGALHVARACLRAGVKRLIQFGTCEEYGDQRAPFLEDNPSRPVSPYSRAKAAATRELQRLFRDEGLPVVILRPFLTYGPGQDPSRFLAQALVAALHHRNLPMTPGRQTREFNRVEDIVDGVMKSAVTPGLEGEIINLACGEEHTLLDVAHMIYRLAGSEGAPEPGALPYREGEAMHFFGSTEKCRRLLGYAPRKNLKEGLAEWIAWEIKARKG